MPARTRTAAAPTAPPTTTTATDLSGQRLLTPGDCLPASFNGKACYFRLDKKAKRNDTWTVGVIPTRALQTRPGRNPGHLACTR